ncbi:MmgE/PrpD family protein [Amycolatopsis thermoflava]|uniref:MmgE/PrpD family protein n=1 Tax=Amycolatopsis thermoflava TaxID=84480 RepID=UPI00041E60CF|nr:MmgE/PrpD family protein [Amycolatopsis thermoflava]
MIADDLGAFHAEPSRAARRLARALPPGPSTVLGATDTTTADVAAFVNGTMVRHPDFNDGYLGLEPPGTRATTSRPVHLASGERLVREVHDAPAGTARR